MNKNVLISGIAGTIVYYLLGWLVYGYLFPRNDHGEESPLRNFIRLFILHVYLRSNFCPLGTCNNFKTGFILAALGIALRLELAFFCYTGDFDLVVIDVIKDVLVAPLMSAIGAGTIGFVHGKTI